MKRPSIRVLVLLLAACGGPAPEPAGETTTAGGETETVAETEAVVGTETVAETETVVETATEADAFVVTSSPPGAAPRAEGGLETLAAWTFPATFEDGARFLPTARGLFAIGPTHISVAHADGATPTRTRESPLGRAPADDEDNPAPPIVDGVLLVRGERGVVAALDVETLAVRWTTNVTESPRSRSEVHLATDGAFVVVTSGTMYGLDPATGRHLFARPFEERERGAGSADFVAAGGLVISTLHAGYDVVARDGRTGETRWTAEIGEARLYAGDVSSLVAIVAHETAVVLDATDGHERARITLPGAVWRGHAATLHDDVLFVEVADGTTSLRVHAFDLTTGGSRWRSEPLALRSDDHAEIVADGSAVYTCTDHRLTALDATTGEARWWAHPDGCVGLRTWAGGVLSRYGGFVFARSETAVVMRDLRVHGTVRVAGTPRADVLVRVGGAHARTDRRGRYDARVSAWDDVPVRVDCEACVPAEVILLASDPERRPTADFDLDEIPGGPFAR